jgi:predicted Rdx family selenoprotein
MADKVRLVHPDTGGEFECDPDAVAAWQERGWKRAGVTAKSKKEESSNG